VRIDTGVRQNDEVSPHYDPMIAKLIVWDQDRPSALRRLRQALADYQIVGVATNLRLLSALAAHPAFAAGEVNTGFIEYHRPALFPDKQTVSDRILALATLGRLLYVEREAASRARQSGDPWSPWHSTSAWRLNDDNMQTLYFRDGDREVTVTAHYCGAHIRLDLPGGSLPVSGELEGEGDLVADLDGVRVRATLVRQGEDMVILSQGESHLLTVHNPLTEGMEDELDAGSLAAPMPGAVIQIMVREGDAVAAGDPLLILEAMKMEHTITAPRAGTVERLHFKVGDQVQEGVELLVLSDAS
jgi:3-methylcrotonyl-CoA carboxylase alpha subunit